MAEFTWSRAVTRGSPCEDCALLSCSGSPFLPANCPKESANSPMSQLKATYRQDRSMPEV